MTEAEAGCLLPMVSLFIKIREHEFRSTVKYGVYVPKPLGRFELA